MFGIVGKKRYLCSVINKATICKTKQPHNTRQNKKRETASHPIDKKAVEQYGIGVIKLLFWEGGDKTRTFFKS